jgi:hypothetical protein
MGTEEKSAAAMAGPASGAGFSASNRGRRSGVEGYTASVSAVFVRLGPAGLVGL